MSRSILCMIRILSLSGLLLLVLLPVSCTTIKYQVQEPYYSTEYVTENHTESYSETVTKNSSISQELTLVPYIVWSNPQLKLRGLPYIWYYGYNLADFPHHDTERIKITFFKQQYYEYLSVSVFDMGPRGQILAPPRISPADDIYSKAVPSNWIMAQPAISTFDTWMNLANIKLDFARFLGGKTGLFLNTENADPVELGTRGATDIAVLICGPEKPQNCRFASSLVWQEIVSENSTVISERIVPVTVERQVLKQRAVIQTRQAPFWEVLMNNNP